MLGQVTGELRLDRLGDAAVQGPRSAVSSDPPPRPGQRGEPVADVVADPVEQAVGDRLVSERKAPGGGFIQRCRDERDREVTPNNGRRLHEVAAAGGDTIEPGTDDVEYGARRPVRIPHASAIAWALADEQRIARW